MRGLLILALGCAAASTALAQTTVYSPRPDTVSLTIYRDGVALVTETRRVELPAGPVTLVFQGVVDSLLARSAVMNGVDRPLAATDFSFDRLTPAALLQRSVGKVVTITQTSSRDGTVTRLDATIESADHGVVLRTVRGGEALYCSGLPERLEFAEIPGELTTTPTLSVQLADGTAGPRTIAVSYLAHGFSWSADYVAHLNQKSDRMDLMGWVTLSNDTNSGFAQAQVQVVAGELNLLDDDEGGSLPPRPASYREQIDQATGLPITSLDRKRTTEEADAAGQLALLHGCYPLATTTDGLLSETEFYDLVLGMRRTRELSTHPITTITQENMQRLGIINREQLVDYQLYRIPWPTDLNARQTKQVAFLAREGIRVERYYRMRHYSPDSVPDPEDGLAVMLRWQNEISAGFGEPLPAGSVRVFEPHLDDEVFAGEGSIDDRPVGLPVELTIGRALDLIAESSIENLRETETGPVLTITLKAAHRFVNDKDAPVTIEVHRMGSRAGITASILRSNLDNRSEHGDIVWRFELPPGHEQWLRYEIRTRYRYN